MTLRRSDYDQAARYLQHACELMNRQAPGKMSATLEVLRLAFRRLSPGDHFVGDAAAFAVDAHMRGSYILVTGVLNRGPRLSSLTDLVSIREVEQTTIAGAITRGNP
jgi:hypothetical protein